MQIRLPKDLQDKLNLAREVYGLKLNEIGDKALRKWNRLGSQLPTQKNGYKDLSNPINIRFMPNLEKGKSADDVRYILTWYLDLPQHKSMGNPVKLYIDKEEQAAISRDIAEGEKNIIDLKMELSQ
jgi:hypothetical protein